MRCRSEFEKSALLSMAYYALKRAGLIKAKSTREAFEKTMKVAVTSSLIEFSRALHAEMEAILCAARNGRIGLRGGTLYVTTYPCDNCVKHILAAGIERVVYIEPYPKSRAKAFFSDMIVDDSGKDKSRKGLTLSQFVGIAPESYVTLFRQHGARKNSTGMLAKPTAMPMPRTSAYLDGFTLYESHIAREAADEEL
jgi:deoxycytidylate deaminase